MMRPVVAWYSPNAGPHGDNLRVPIIALGRWQLAADHVVVRRAHFDIGGLPATRLSVARRGSGRHAALTARRGSTRPLCCACSHRIHPVVFPNPFPTQQSKHVQPPPRLRAVQCVSSVIPIDTCDRTDNAAVDERRTQPHRHRSDRHRVCGRIAAPCTPCSMGTPLPSAAPGRPDSLGAL
jgi:hypothetical protein